MDGLWMDYGWIMDGLWCIYGGLLNPQTKKTHSDPKQFRLTTTRGRTKHIQASHQVDTPQAALAEHENSYSCRRWRRWPYWNLGTIHMTDPNGAAICLVLHGSHQQKPPLC